VTRILKILFFLVVSVPCVAQKDSFVLIRAYEGDIANAVMDNLDNLYIVSSKGQVKKISAAGDSVGVYNELKNFGKLYSIDVSNPLKLLLFYKDFSTVVVLDRFLANVNSINLRRVSPIVQAGAVGVSYDDNVWVFDEYDSKLKKIDYQGNLLLETPDLRTVFNLTVSPQKIINDNGLVYLADTTNVVFFFDTYGSFKKKIPLMRWQSIAVSNNNLVSTNNEIITVYNSSTLMQTSKKNPFFKPYFHSFASADRVISFSASNLEVYQYRF
jgi:hypothetical protein